MLSVLHGETHAGSPVATWPLPSVETLAAVSLIAVATVAGAWLARRGSGRSALPLAAASGVLLVIAALDLLPDAWAEAREAGVPPWAVPATVLVSWCVMDAVVRVGCPCEPSRAGGIGTAAGLALHRFLEGATLALTASIVVVAALFVHAAGEGLALAALLGARPRRRLAPWIALACVSPVAGGFVMNALPVPAALMPLLLAFVAAVLAQGAWVALKVARRRASHEGRRLRSPMALAMASAALVTALVVLIGSASH
ncbi:hypothetical protein [Microtetraspora niveoalba]|uniref:hypothetical protein n=1 Tax=Microtetraspora niveoalba TaxID=46175 RepID=UPI000A03EFBB|nr:hypothetical protein [Microtetraspora niveoalba]